MLFDIIPFFQKLKRLALCFGALTGIIRIIEPNEGLVSVIIFSKLSQG
jgi:hypothetical protein